MPIATGKKQLVAVLRLAGTDTASDPYAYLGYEWDFSATVSGIDFMFTNRRTGTGGQDNHGVRIGDASVKHDFKVIGSTFVWTVPRTEIKQLARAKQTFTLFRANSAAFGISADSAPANTNRYVDLTPSCVKAL